MLLITSSLCVLFYAVSLTNAQLFAWSYGPCPEIPRKQNFDLQKYVGKWYNSETFPAPFQFAMDCITAEYTLKPDGTVKVNNSAVRDIKIFGKTIFKQPTYIIGEAKVLDPSKPADLYVKFPGQPEFDKTRANYLVLDTDYVNYSLVYSCSRLASIFPKVEFAWILGRVRGQKPAQTDQLKALLTSYKVNVKNFKTVDWSSC
ncbi:apolipoprotein D-like [Biomphalaria glabrata]|uniref:Apolipoprotein D n=1 Tax=Biomphalaria glabrata TaxID=6526 RepID=A0A9W3AQ84_BIOGL|nr:apolipoprotein D-like [Biomphalaria glabrata]XP_055889393.1 apolipoprotein D-like [Biomphalaria glabrata]